MRLSPLFRIVLSVVGFVSIGIALLYSDEAAIHLFTGTGGRTHISGSFESNYGNAGEISFNYTPVSSTAPRAYLYGTGIEGYFWSETTGWAVFTGGSSITPRNVANGVRAVWDGTGYAWSEYAGWFSFSGVEYYPDTATLSGLLWSDTLGWVPLHTIADNIGLGFIGRVKIIGNIGGKSTYSVNLANYDQVGSFDMTTVTSMINTVRKNYAINTRNTVSSINTNFSLAPTQAALGGVYYYVSTGSIAPYVKYSTLENLMNTTGSPRSIVVVGGDVYIDTGIVLPTNTLPHAIIALKNENSVGGNIYINGKVTKISASLISEGSLYSGRRNTANTGWDLYNIDTSRTTTLPNYQLYIKGSVITRNTIGGAGFIGTPRCPFTESTCSYDQAIRYDLNYFRDYQTGAVIPATDLPLHRGYIDTTYDDKSLVIEYDPRMMTDPPPGL